MADLPGWPYWKVVSITGQSGAGTDYQVELEIGDSAGGDFHLEGHCTNFPQDIRITDDDGITLLDHWVEDITADPIVVHVEVKDDLGSNQDIRVYYGKSGETSVSSGANTFLQYTASESSTYLKALVTTPGSNLYYRTKFKNSGSPSNVVFGISTTIGWDDDFLLLQSYSTANLRYTGTSNNGADTKDSEAPHFADNVYHIGEIKFLAGVSEHGYIDNNEISDGVASNLPDETMGLAMWKISGTLVQDWAFIAKYNSPEPTFSSAGAEQTPPVGVIINQFQGANIGADLYNGVIIA